MALSATNENRCASSIPQIVAAMRANDTVIIDFKRVRARWLRPNGLELSRAASIDRNDNRAESVFQNRCGILAASGVGWSALLGRAFETRFGSLRKQAFGGRRYQSDQPVQRRWKIAWMNIINRVLIGLLTLQNNPIVSIIGRSRDELGRLLAPILT